MAYFLKLLRLALGAFLAIIVAVLATYIYLAPSLPGVAVLRDVELQVPLKVYSRDGKLIAVYGEQRREPLGVDEIPELLVQAFLAAEDDRFYEHLGVDYQGLARAALYVLLTGEKRQGGSTVTMQLARNFFLDNERTYRRKLKEIFLALRIEHEFNKNEILELYLNKIYLGNRAYGVGAAAEVYYGRSVHDLNLAQIAMIAGLPKAPSRFNPIVNPERAVIRRNYVLGRMHKLEFIDDDAYHKMLDEPVSASVHYPRVEMNAPYIGEMARAQMFGEYGAEAYTKGYRVYTTINSKLQRQAQLALRNGLHAYDRRHGWRGAESHLELEFTGDDVDQIAFEKLDEVILDMDLIGGLMPAVVTRVEPLEIEAYLGEQQFAVVSIDQAKWARPYISENTMGEAPEDFTGVLAPGDVIRITRAGTGEWALSQVPEAAGAFVAIDPQNGSVLALVGGYDYLHSKFNRVTQAKRQPGSSFKPFIYSAALESGFTPASIINDAPVVHDGSGLESAWRPKNYSGKFFGPTRLREALVKSRNMVSIRVLRSVGHRYTEQHITNFGFGPEQLPQGLSLALGSGVATPMEMARGYAVFANGGHYVEPFVIERIEDVRGEVLFRSSPLMVCEADCLDLQQQLYSSGEEIIGEDGAAELGMRVAERVLPKENAYQMVSMMHDVIQSGTGRRARQLGRSDLAGKTGTTNEQRDAWFCGFNGDIVAIAWVGFDQHKPLGRKEVGSVTALPIWIEFMRAALQGKPENKLKRPETIVSVRIDPATGQRVDSGNEQGIDETFRMGYVPAEGSGPGTPPAYPRNDGGMGTPEQLF
ncbi:MAG: penicillin-binding protein 1A [Gammaproteobacteria bacterium]|nr:penicillin-binding protein 1A [Gammaproteobacteria bacterium]